MNQRIFSLFLFTAFFAVLNSGKAYGDTIPVSVTKFTNKAGASNCRYNWIWWESNLGDGFSDMLANELVKSGKIELYERETIRDIYDGEHQLVNAEDDGTLEKGKFKKAKYTFVGTVTEFEYCASRTGGSVNVGAIAGLFGVPGPDVSVGLKGAKAHLAMTLRIIETRTGRVIQSIRSEADISDQKFEFDSSYGDFSTQENSPMGRAAQLAIEKAAVEALALLK